MRALAWLVSREVRRLRRELSGARLLSQERRAAVDKLTASLARSEARRVAAERQLREVDGQ